MLGWGRDGIEKKSFSILHFHQKSARNRDGKTGKNINSQ